MAILQLILFKSNKVALRGRFLFSELSCRFVEQKQPIALIRCFLIYFALSFLGSSMTEYI